MIDKDARDDDAERLLALLALLPDDKRLWAVIAKGNPGVVERYGEHLSRANLSRLDRLTDPREYDAGVAAVAKGALAVFAGDGGYVREVLVAHVVALVDNTAFDHRVMVEMWRAEVSALAWTLYSTFMTEYHPDVWP